MRPTLSELESPELTVTLRGTQYAVKPIDGYGMQLTQSIPDDDRLGMIRATYKIAARCLGMTFDEAFGTEEQVGFTEHEVTAVLDAAQSQAKRVEAQAAPNSEAAAERSQTLSPAG